MKLRPVKPAEITRVVAEYYNLHPTDLRGDSRFASVVLARHVAWWMIRKHSGIGFREIGLMFGARDHTSVCHGVAKISRKTNQDPYFSAQAKEIERLLSKLDLIESQNFVDRTLASLRQQASLLEASPAGGSGHGPTGNSIKLSVDDFGAISLKTFRPQGKDQK